MKNQVLTNNKVDRSSTKIVNQNGRRITNLPPSASPSDPIIQSEFTEYQTKVAAALKTLGVKI